MTIYMARARIGLVDLAAYGFAKLRYPFIGDKYAYSSCGSFGSSHMNSKCTSRGGSRTASRIPVKTPNRVGRSIMWHLSYQHL